MASTSPVAAYVSTTTTTSTVSIETRRRANDARHWLATFQYPAALIGIARKGSMLLLFRGCLGIHAAVDVFQL